MRTQLESQNEDDPPSEWLWPVLTIVSIGSSLLMTVSIHDEMDHIGATIFMGLVFFFANLIWWILLYSLLHFIFRTLRRGYRGSVRYSRTHHLRGIQQQADALMEDQGYASRLPIRFEKGVSWKRLLVQKVLLWVAISIAGLAMIVACAALFGIIGVAFESDPLIGVRTLLGIALGCGGYATVVLMAYGRMSHKDLSTVATAAVQAASRGDVASLDATADNGPIHCPSGGHLVIGATIPTPMTLHLSLQLFPLEFNLRMVGANELDLEANDDNLGRPEFDQATLLKDVARPSELLDGWLTPNVRCLLLALLNEGAYVKDGTLWRTVSLWTEFDSLQRVIPLIFALDREFIRLRKLDPKERALRALEEGDETARTLMLLRLDMFDIPERADSICRLWVERGDGVTRADAAARLPREEAYDTLKALWLKPGTSVDVRGRALARLLLLVEHDHALPLVDLSEGLASAQHQVLEGALIAGRLLRTLREPDPVEMRRFPLTRCNRYVGMAGIVRATLEGQLLAFGKTQSIAGVPRRSDWIDAVYPVLETVNHTDSKDKLGIHLWTLHGDALTDVLSLDLIPDGHTEVLRQRLKTIQGMLEKLLQDQVGGLALSDHAAEGGLSLEEE